MAINKNLSNLAEKYRMLYIRKFSCQDTPYLSFKLKNDLKTKKNNVFPNVVLDFNGSLGAGADLGWATRRGILLWNMV